jgi:hypothetical protein
MEMILFAGMRELRQVVAGQSTIPIGNSRIASTAQAKSVEPDRTIFSISLAKPTRTTLSSLDGDDRMSAISYASPPPLFISSFFSS